MGGKRCFAVCPSDTAVALAALDASINVAGPGGERKIAILDFIGPLGKSLKRDEIVRDVEVPQLTKPSKQRFLKFTLRKPVDFAIVSVASVVIVENGICVDARIALGAVAPGPVRAKSAEEVLINRPISEASAAEAAQTALSGAKPLGMNGYKIEIAKSLIKRALLGGD
jgi:xanthine dehydrogenase YagS FAD-binding subunit